MKSRENIKPLAFPIYYWSVLLIALIGLAAAGYLSASHYRVYTDLGYKSFCAVSKAINCDTVSQSTYSIFLQAPVPVWGVFGYAVFLFNLIVSRFSDLPRKRLWPTLTVIALCYSFYSVILAYISILHIKSYCIMCMLSHAVNLTLLFMSWLVYRRFGESSIFAGLKEDVRWLLTIRNKSIVSLGVILILAGMIATLFPAYWEKTEFPSLTAVAKGVTTDGHPWIGAREPQLVITEFTDYQCFQCRKMHNYLRQLVVRYPHKLRLVHRHFPMDHTINPIVKEPYHVGSAKMALMAIFASEKGKFWELNDKLFNMDTQGGLFNIRKIAKSVGLDVYELAASVGNSRYQFVLKKDLKTGISLGIDGTPGYLVDDEIYTGHLPATVFNAIVK